MLAVQKRWVNSQNLGLQAAAPSNSVVTKLICQVKQVFAVKGFSKINNYDVVGVKLQAFEN